MNFEALQWLINTIISTYKCEECTWKINQKNISIKKIEWNSVTLWVICSACWKKSFIKSEVVSLNLDKLNLSKDQVLQLKKWIEKRNDKKIWWLKKSINDNLILELNKDLKREHLNVSELFSIPKK